MLIETITYRLGAHTTADDPTRYRDPVEVETWKAKDPLVRFRRFLSDRELLNEELDRQMLAEVEAEINEAVSTAEAMPNPAPDSMFTTAQLNLSPRQQAQRQEMLDTIRER
jgi:pyruvate dehydrogenase E1 component alpha subunit